MNSNSSESNKLQTSEVDANVIKKNECRDRQVLYTYDE